MMDMEMLEEERNRRLPRVEEEEETTSAGTAARKATSPLTARSPRNAGDASRKVT